MISHCKCILAIPTTKSFGMDAVYKARLRRLCRGKVCPSFRSLAKKFGCDDKTIKRRLESIGIVREKRKTVPELSKTQEITQWYRVRRLNKSLKEDWKDFDVVMDESYFHVSNGKRNQYYYSGLNETSKEVKTVGKAKFTKKVKVITQSHKVSSPGLFSSQLSDRKASRLQKCFSLFPPKFHLRSPSK